MRRNYFNSKNCVIIDNYWKNVTPQEKDAAIVNKQYFICNQFEPKYPLMTYVVYDPNLQSPDNLLAIFRNIEDAKLFIDALVEENKTDGFKL
jgi:hypothetical protein